MILDALNRLLERLRAGGGTSAEQLPIIRKFVHSPIVALLVQLSPNKYDDMILQMLKDMLPPTPTPTP